MYARQQCFARPPLILGPLPTVTASASHYLNSKPSSLKTFTRDAGPSCILQSIIFEGDSYGVASKHYNLIAFSFDLGHLALVLKAASANLADSVDIKLTQKQVSASCLCNAVVLSNGVRIR